MWAASIFETIRGGAHTFVFRGGQPRLASEWSAVDLDTYLDALASSAPTPGGGSAATIVGALGTALLAMVARITLDAVRLAPVHPAARTVIADAERLRSRFAAARPRDEAAYGAVVSAMALPRSTDDEKSRRTERLQAALKDAAAAPLAVAELTAEAMEAAAHTAALENKNLMSDVVCAVAFLRAAFDASAANVRVNHEFLRDLPTVETQRERLERAGLALTRAETRAREKFG
jgi:methenyltetrahydrofolate cyclohydrolase